jgi:hypothetical protein
MDRAMLKVHLDMAERHVLDGERHIARQRKIVAELERDGHDSDHATRLLRSFEQTQALHVADRDRRRKVLAAIYSGG